MSIRDVQSDPIITNRNISSDGNNYSKPITNETISVIDGKATLHDLPDRRYKVLIKDMYEVDFNSKLENKNQFKVDYSTTGTLFFHKDFENKEVTVDKYYSKGVIYYPASRVYTKITSVGKVVETLDESLNNAENIEGNINNAINSVDKSIGMIKDYISYGEDTKNEISNLILQSDELNQDMKKHLESGNNWLDKSYEVFPILEKQVEIAEDASNKLSQESDIADVVLEKLTSLTKNSKFLEESLIDLNSKSESNISYIEEILNKSSNIDKSLKELINSGKNIESILNKAVSNAKTEKESLSEAIEVANVVSENIFDNAKIIKDATENGLNAVELIEKLILNSKQLEESLIGLNLKSENNIDVIREVIKESEIINNKLRESLKSGKDIDSMLNEVIKVGQQLKIDLNERIKTGKELLTSLNLSVEGANQSQNELKLLSSKADDCIEKLKEETPKAEESYKKLQELYIDVAETINQGNELKDGLQMIIEGSDFENVITNIKELEKQKASKEYVDAELKNKANILDLPKKLSDLEIDMELGKDYDDVINSLKENKVDSGDAIEYINNLGGKNVTLTGDLIKTSYSSDKYVTEEIELLHDKKVDKEEGKCLSDNNYTDEDKERLRGSVVVGKSKPNSDKANVWIDIS